MHKRWTKSIIGFSPVSERLCYIDVKLFGVKYRIVSAYFPDSTYPDLEVHKMYDQLSELVTGARKDEYKLLVGGDFNARVGGGPDTAVHPAAGPHGLGEQNSRGQWLLAWASRSNFKITNTFFRKQVPKLVTHIGTQGQQSQLDYVLVDNWSRTKLRDTEAGTWIDLGSDHAALRVVLDFSKPSATKKRHTRAKRKAAWPPTDLEAYRIKLDALLDDASVSDALQERCGKIEDALMEASCFASGSSDPILEESSALQMLIDERKALPITEAHRRTELSKSIKKEVRRKK